MTRPRTLISSTLLTLGIVSVAAVGIAVAQNQDDTKSPPAKTPAKVAPKPTTDPAPDDAAAAQRNRDAATDKDAPGTERPPEQAGRGEKAANTTEEQRAAILGAQFDGQGDQAFHVKSVDQNGVLARGGLRQNDRIVSVEGRTFTNPRHFEAFIWSQAGRQVPIIIDRGGKQYTIQVMVPQHLANSGWLGVNLDEGDADVKGEAEVKGARVTQVYPNGPAARAGVQQGDVITQINGQPVDGSAEAVMLVRELQPQAKAELVVLRDKDEVKIPVIVGNRGNTFAYQSFYGGPQQQGFYQQNQQQGQGGPDQRFAGQQQFAGNNQFNGVPPHAMELEHHRRMAEQNERIEDELRQLREEVKQLRELLEKK